MVGIGDAASTLAVYIGNRPPLDEYLTRDSLVPAVAGELARIGRETGNHWRKIINIYAKLGFMLDAKQCLTWQAYRDSVLLTQGSKQSLLFDRVLVSDTPGAPSKTIRIICGKTHAATLVDMQSLQWIDNDFAIDLSQRLIVTPYFDYRQLSNVKLERLRDIIRGQLGQATP